MTERGLKRSIGRPGYTDLRRGIEGLAGITRFQFELVHHIGILFSFFVEDVVTASKRFYGMAMVSF